MSGREAVYTHARTHIHFGRGSAAPLRPYVAHPCGAANVDDDAEMFAR